MTKERLTSQKQIILDYLKSVKTHPSAEEIFLKVRKKLPRISRGTVYRVLDNFKEKGEAQTIPAKGVAHFDGDTSPHAHFICVKCHRIFDIFDICRECNIIKRRRIKVGKIISYQIYFHGLCKYCSKK